VIRRSGGGKLQIAPRKAIETLIGDNVKKFILDAHRVTSDASSGKNRISLLIPDLNYLAFGGMIPAHERRRRPP
jgi:hypothetical protein